jgi:Rps23 Pro-64 3,4-dihydroxylase Tpa1-like proline 4-hydroxylase
MVEGLARLDAHVPQDTEAQGDAIRRDIEQMIVARIDAEGDRLAAEFAETHRGGCGITFLDDALPQTLCREIAATIPDLEVMVRRRSLGERKYCLAQTRGMDARLQACVAAFASKAVADKAGFVFDLGRVVPDSVLYNGGLTVMTPGDFMRPHLDNSHNLDRRRRRRLVVLYYCSADWSAQSGGSLSIWSRSPLRRVKVVPFAPNRLVFMEVGDGAWHSVDPISGDANRVNITTYFYDADETVQPVRLTRFMGWPGEPVAQTILEGQFRLRMLAQRLGAGRLVKNTHTNSMA